MLALKKSIEKTTKFFDVVATGKNGKINVAILANPKVINHGRRCI